MHYIGLVVIVVVLWISVPATNKPKNKLNDQPAVLPEEVRVVTTGRETEAEKEE